MVETHEGEEYHIVVFPQGRFRHEPRYDPQTHGCGGKGKTGHTRNNDIASPALVEVFLLILDLCWCW